jgi:putative membrane protein
MVEQEQDQFTGDDSPKVRSHLANERTFLAWTRTGVGMMAFGFLVARLRFEVGKNGTSAKDALQAEWVGVLFAGAGIVAVLLATYRYFVVREQIRTDRFAPAGAYLALLGVLVILLGLGVIAFITGII